MALSGHLRDIPLADVMQLLHGTQKSGVLNVVGRKGSCHFVFERGYIVSAQHPDRNIRIGDKLLERGLLSLSELDAALEEQKKRVNFRKPLILTIVEMGLVDRDPAYAALQAFISEIIVEVLSWTSGRFSIEPKLEVPQDEFRYDPQQVLSLDLSVAVQDVLFDAMCLYDEMIADSRLTPEEDISEDDFAQIASDLLGLSEDEPQTQLSKDRADSELTASDLGLCELIDSPQ